VNQQRAENKAKNFNALAKHPSISYSAIHMGKRQNGQDHWGVAQHCEGRDEVDIVLS
jgi:hypothetical protein